MASAATTAEDSNASTDKEDHVSLALSLPFEMVEAILVHLSAPDLLFAAANVPKRWRDVIENSTEVWRILARHQYDEKTNWAKTRRQTLSIFNQERKTIKCFFLKGMLFAHRDSFGNTGFIFAPGSDNAPLEIPDPRTTSLRYEKKGRIGHWALHLFDLKGNLVCKQEVKDDSKALLGRYFQAIIEDRENMERYLRGGNSIDQIPDAEDDHTPARPTKRRERGSD
jgi:hypothetical protein